MLEQEQEEQRAYEYANARSSHLHRAMVEVMKTVKNIDKSMTIGEGKMSYKGIADKDVKFVLGTAMAENRITCVPVDYDVKTRVDRWEENAEWNGKITVKQKQSVFTEVNAKYLITHVDSGESQIIVGYGHGIDSQDKSAGKATTYALKNALLYSFLVPTGAIDDTDNTHFDSIETPQPQRKPVETKKVAINKERFENAIKQITEGNYTAEALRMTFKLTKEQEAELLKLENPESND
jgi:hypothetical protein